MALDLGKPLRRKHDDVETIYYVTPLRCGKKFVFEWQCSRLGTWHSTICHSLDGYENVPETRELDCWVAFDATPDAQGCIGSLWTTEHVAKNLAASFSDGACFRLQRTYEVGEGLS